ncbi:MAG: ABC-2 type transport system permease protein [Polaribacter sp.]|jgi:ABC-2 type transport system permease protein
MNKGKVIDPVFDKLNLVKPNLINIYYMEAKTETIRLFRTPGFCIPTLLFPIMFYVFFGILFSMNKATMPTYLMITYATFGVIGPALFSFGVGIAIERGQGWFDLKEVSPMPASAYIISRIVLSIIFSLLIIMLLFSIAAIFGDVRLFHSQWILLAIILILGSLPFCAVGMTLGLFLKSSSAPATINLIYLPMGFLSGLWLPINFLPDFMQSFANLLPPYHLAQLSLKVVEMDIGAPIILHIGVLLLYTLFFMFLAMKAYNKKDKQ